MSNPFVCRFVPSLGCWWRTTRGCFVRVVCVCAEADGIVEKRAVFFVMEKYTVHIIHVPLALDVSVSGAWTLLLTFACAFGRGIANAACLHVPWIIPPAINRLLSLFAMKNESWTRQTYSLQVKRFWYFEFSRGKWIIMLETCGRRT